MDLIASLVHYLIHHYVQLLSEPSVAEAMQRQAYVDMVLMSYQPSAFLQTTTSLLTSLRGMGHRCVFFNKEGCSFDEVKSHCKFHNVPYLLLVDSDVSLYKVCPGVMWCCVVCLYWFVCTVPKLVCNVHNR